MTFLPSLHKNYSENSSTILLETVLQLLGEQLKKLSHSDFFATELGEYVSQLCKSVSSLQNKIAEPDPDVPLITEVVESIWRATQFLTGTTSNRVPYEVTYLLREVLLDWGLGESIVTTSVNQSPDFYCERAGIAPDALLSELNLPGLTLSGHLVQMGVPEIFQHMPLLCSPMYHEVGHYVEEHERLITRMLITNGDQLLQAMPGLKEFEMASRMTVAKAWATLDVLSGGRAVLGVGAGHVEEEFAALGVPFAERGARLDEAIDAVRAALSDEYATHHGPTWSYEAMGQRPRPVQARLPIWVGGSSPAAVRRAAERGDGWLPQGPPKEGMGAAIDRLHDLRAAAGRAGEPFTIGALSGPLHVGEPDWDAGRCVSGPPAKVAAYLRTYRDLGCHQVQVGFASRSADELCDQIAAFAADVAPLVNG
jgi:probable F420-dependent oxidoreductase